MHDDVDKIVNHLSTSQVIGEGQLEDGDLITGSVVIMRVERLDDPTPAFCVVHTGDYITATGLIALAQGVIQNGFEEE